MYPKVLRMILQSAMLGFGADLTIRGDVTAVGDPRLFDSRCAQSTRSTGTGHRPLARLRGSTV